MPRVFFSGVVHPERASLSVSNINSTIVDADGRTKATITLNIYANQVTAAVDSEVSDLYTLRNLVRSETEFVTSVAGFLFGYGYDVEITKVFDPQLKDTRVFGIDIPIVSERTKGRDTTALLNAIVPLCYGPDAVYLRRCLTDLSAALRRLDDTAFYCFRALESLRQSFGEGRTEREQWEAMAHATGSSKDAMEPLRRHAFPARHGPPKPLTGEERGELYTFTWRIVERYIDYRLKQSGTTPIFSEPSGGSP
jgi:hypothetical protein